MMKDDELPPELFRVARKKGTEAPFTGKYEEEHVGGRGADRSGGTVRTEVICKNCGAHLGHVFDDGPPEKGGKRYCINSVCLELKKK